MIPLLLTSFAFGNGLEDKPAMPKVDFHVALMHGDPLGSLEERTVTNLAKSNTVLLDSQFGVIGFKKLNAPGWEDRKCSVTLTPQFRDDGSVFVKIQTKLDDFRNYPAVDTTGLETSIILKNTVKRVRILSASPTEQTWLEISAVKSVSLPKLPSTQSKNIFQLQTGGCSGSRSSRIRGRDRCQMS
jgi:hypothetical protein